MEPDYAIPFRRIKVVDDPTTVVCESEEYFNSGDVIDVTRLNIAKPGELFVVVIPRLNAIYAYESLDRSDVDYLLRTSEWVYVIEQEDFARRFKSEDIEEKRRFEEEMAKNPVWCRSWWYRELCSILHIDDSNPKPPKEYHLHFIDRKIKVAYAYDSQPEAPTAVNHDTRHSHIFDDSRKKT